MSKDERIQLYVPEVTKDELVSAVSAAFESGVYTQGKEVPRFEKKLSETTGAADALAVSNGTTALNLAVRAANWGEGNKVVTSPMSFIATTNVLLQEKVIPVFGDVDENFQLDLGKAKELIENDPSIVGILMPVIYGYPVDVKMVREIKAAFPELVIIEDAAQALAPKSMGLGVGDSVDIATYSFHENKVMTTMGEGGGVTSDNSELIERMRRMREQGRIDTPDWLSLVELGYNYRMTEAQAHTGSLQLERLDSILSKRSEIAARMSKQLLESNLPLRLPSSHRSWFAYYVVAETPDEARHISKTMNDAGINTRLTPMPAIPTYNHVARSVHEDYSQGVEELANRVIMLPLHTKLEEEDVDRIVDTLKASFSKKTQRNETSSAAFYDSLASQYAEVRAERSEYIDRVNQITIDAIVANNSTTPRMLDVGCGDGARGKEIARLAGYSLLSIDNSSQMVVVARGNGVEAIASDITTVDDRIGGKGDFGAVAVLWNVLGHVPGEQARLDALKNINTLLSDDGVLILDVNNQFNEAQYGKENTQRNRQKVQQSGGDATVGDFTTTRTDESGTKFSTVSHIFHTDEVVQLLRLAGFEPTVQYVDYATGDDASESSGQIVVTAKKNRLSLS